MFQIDRGGYFLNYKGAREALYVPPEAFLGKRIEDVLPSEISELTMHCVAQALESREMQIYKYQLPMGGDIRSYECRMVASKENEVLAIVRDISEQKRAEKEHILLEEAIAQAAECIVITDKDATIQYVNPAFERLSGHSREEAVGENPRILQSGEHTDAFYREMWDTLTSGRVWYGHFKNRKKDGTLYDEEASISPICNNAGEIVNHVAVKRDVTEERRLKRELQHAQRMESMGTLTGGIAHNFRNILAAISMESQLIELKYADDAQLKGHSSRIYDSSMRGARLVDQLIHFSRKEGGKGLVILNLAQLVGETCDLISKSFDQLIDIRTDISERLPIMGDRASLSQVFMNICTNARDAMPGGGELHIKARNEGDAALVIISDTGCGMDKGTREQCFDPFFTTKGPDRGTGLGLSTAYGTVKDHEGEIYVYSEPDKGTTFKLYFPLAVSDEESKGERAAGFLHGSGQRVLIVDDEIEFLEPVEGALKAFGYKVAAVTSCKGAIRKYKSWRPDVVLLDRNMPEIDGITCAQKILEYDPGARIVLVSGYDESGPTGIDPETQTLIKEYLTKPIDMFELSRVLGRLCSPDYKSQPPPLKRVA